MTDDRKPGRAVLSPVYLVASGAVSGPLTVRVWTVKDFPSSREVTSQWDDS